MTDRPAGSGWSDAELREAERYANVTHGETWYRRFLSALPAYSAAEMREKERDGWHNSLLTYGTTPNGLPWAKCVERVLAIRDKELPSLLPPTPPPLVLSTGTWTWGAPCWDRQSEPNRAYHSPICKTASDAEKLAAWLRAYGTEQEAK